jgi:hypothetical protein
VGIDKPREKGDVAEIVHFCVFSNVPRQVATWEDRLDSILVDDHRVVVEPPVDSLVGDSLSEIHFP